MTFLNKNYHLVVLVCKTELNNLQLSLKQCANPIVEFIKQRNAGLYCRVKSKKVNFYYMKICATLLLLVTILSASHCRKGNDCEEPLDVRNSYMLLTFKNNSGNYLYSEVSPIYNRDSLKIYDEYGNKISLLYQLSIIPGTSSRYWEVDLGPIYNPQKDSQAFSSEYCKKFIIKYSYNVTDTINTCYRISQFKCGSEFSTLKVFHKGVLLKEENNGVISTSVTIIKN